MAIPENYRSLVEIKDKSIEAINCLTAVRCPFLWMCSKMGTGRLLESDPVSQSVLHSFVIILVTGYFYSQQSCAGLCMKNARCKHCTINFY